MKTFKDQESCCDNVFRENAPFWHLYTSGKDMPLLFRNDDEFKFVMNVIAREAFEFPDVRIIAFEVMGNHVHFLLSGQQSRCFMYFRGLRRRIARGIGRLPLGFSPSLKAVGELRALRNTIVYIHRNGYVADPRKTPFSYPWGTGPFYYCNPKFSVTLADLKDSELRLMFRSRSPKLPDNYLVVDSYVSPSSYCAINLGMSMFREAHHYYSLLNKNVEAYGDVAVEIGDGAFLTDNELFSVLAGIVNDRYGSPDIRKLTKQQKLELARKLRYEYCSSNSQISRLLNLSQFEVDAAFPLSAQRGK